MDRWRDGRMEVVRWEFFCALLIPPLTSTSPSQPHPLFIYHRMRLSLLTYERFCHVISLIPTGELFVLFVADAAGLPGTPEPERRPGGVVSTADRLRVPPPLPQPFNNACHPGPQGLVWLPAGQCDAYCRREVTRVLDVSEESAVSNLYIVAL